MGFPLLWLRSNAAVRSTPRVAWRRLFGGWLSKPSFSRLTIAARIAAIALTLAVPLNLVIIAVIWRLSEAASEAQRTSLLYTARSVAAAVDAKLDKYMGFAQTLAHSPALLEDNLDVFQAEARRASASMSASETLIVVADLEGQQLINTARQPRQRLPMRDSIGIAVQKHAFEVHSAVIADLRFGMITQEWMIHIEVPVFKNGQPFRALALAVKSQAFYHLLNAQQMPKGWLACIIDHQGRFIARVPDYERNVGQLAPEGFRKVKDRDGIFEFLSVERDPIVTANAHSAVSGWPIAIAVKKAEMQAAGWNAVRWAMVLGGGFSILSLLFTGLIARSIAGPIAKLRQKAGALLAEPALSMPSKGPPEVRDLCRALKQSAANRDRSDRALRESEERFRGIFENAATGIAILDLDGRIQSCNPAFTAMLGYSEEELRRFTFAELVHPEDRDANVSQRERLVMQEIPSFEIVIRYLRKDGKPSWADKYVSLLRDAAGKPTHIIALVTDITERKRQENQITLLMREVNHRSKNMLSIVQAIARQTAAANPDDFIERFAERIQALSTSQDLLVANEWRGADLHALARSQLAHFKDLIGTRIELCGPPVLISASAAQPIGMALHELATNAGKYGALSNDKGRVEVHWSVEPGDGGGETFVICWRESGGPPVTDPARSGFGSTVLGQVVKQSLDAQVELDFAPAGLVWRLRCAAGEIMDRSASAR